MYCFWKNKSAFLDNVSSPMVHEAEWKDFPRKILLFTVLEARKQSSLPCSSIRTCLWAGPDPVRDQAQLMSIGRIDSELA